jgi:hypothetical protein
MTEEGVFLAQLFPMSEQPHCSHFRRQGHFETFFIVYGLFAPDWVIVIQ